MVFSVKTYNNINQIGLKELGNHFQIDGDLAENPDAYIIRSQNLHDTVFPDNLKAIARAGAGTNNIPVDEATEKGIVVFNTPGANANAVKEAVLASILLSARDYIAANAWVNTLSGDDVPKQIEAGKKQFAGSEIAGKTLGVIGLGAIGARIANDALNANTVGLLGANAIVMTLYYMLYDRPRWWNIIALPTLGILAATGSRKALVFVVVGTVLLFVFKSLRSANVVNSIAKIIGSLLALTIIGIAVLQLPMFSEVLDRMSSMVDAFSGTGGDSSTIIRLALVDIGWDLFYQSPITGVGVNNPSVLTYFLYGKENYYLHNNYIELLAGTGIIGLLAYYSMYVYIAYNLIRYRNFHSNEYVMVLILFLSQIVMDMGMVSYESKSTYFYMMMFYLEVQLLRKGRKNEAQQVM